jgi:nucleotide-binding universal stress UspA family protein
VVMPETPPPRATHRLIAYDGSVSALRALKHAAKLHREGDKAAVIFVQDGPSDSAPALEEACHLLELQGIEATPIAAAGKPAQTICMTAERLGYDTIVIGRRNGRDSGLLLLGSVAARVVSGAAGHVLVVA